VSDPLSYASAPYQQTKPATVGFLLGLLGLGLILLGGCFMIGIMIMQFADSSAGFGNSTQASYWTLGRMAFLVMLYLCAFGCFGGGAVIIKRGVQKLMLA